VEEYEEEDIEPTPTIKASSKCAHCGESYPSLGSARVRHWEICTGIYHFSSILPYIMMINYIYVYSKIIRYASHLGH